MNFSKPFPTPMPRASSPHPGPSLLHPMLLFYFLHASHYLELSEIISGCFYFLLLTVELLKAPLGQESCVLLRVALTIPRTKPSLLICAQCQIKVPVKIDCCRQEGTEHVKRKEKKIKKIKYILFYPKFQFYQIWRRIL